MLFNSYVFLFTFLPITLFGFFGLARWGSKAALAWLAGASLFFYGWWNPAYIPLLTASILVNYFIGMKSSRSKGIPTDLARKRWATLGVVSNLMLLGYYKYANFFVANLELASGSRLGFAEVMLPIGISFFTFTQIAYIVDAYRGVAKEYDLTRYTLFVTFFPHLIAGPILHHKEMMPQFGTLDILKPNAENMALGFSIFFAGLFKKVVFADHFATYASPIFSAAASGAPVSFGEGWVGALSYTLQLYFDFSGYSDMAIGLALLFNIRLPMNFDSPYKATNIIDFWRRWHMTLSRYLRDYLYIPLGGSRSGSVRRYVNLMLTMILGGLWHGAGWTFLAWGLLHGCYLVVNHAWRAVRGKLGLPPASLVERLLGMQLTFLAVVFAWVFFRADRVGTASHMVGAMLGQHGLSSAQWFPLLPNQSPLWVVGSILGGLVMVWTAPNLLQLTQAFKPVVDPENQSGRPTTLLSWSMTPAWGLAVGIVGALPSSASPNTPNSCTSSFSSPVEDHDTKPAGRFGKACIGARSWAVPVDSLCQPWGWSGFSGLPQLYGGPGPALFWRPVRSQHGPNPAQRPACPGGR